MTTIRGRAWVFGDAIDTDIIIPARYLVLPLDEMKLHAMEPERPEFASGVAPGDVIVGGRNFGCGSSREQAPAVLKELGVATIVAVSFARIFFRNAINLGIPVVECPEIDGRVEDGRTIEVDPATGEVRIGENRETLHGTRLPDFLMEIVRDGGLVAHLSGR
jgi:3-isopropylmalate dehydratase small subunit